MKSKKVYYVVFCIICLFIFSECGVRQEQQYSTDLKDSHQEDQGVETTVSPSTSTTAEVDDKIKESAAIQENKRTDNFKTEKVHKNTDLVKVREYIPEIKEDLRYATKNNFTGEIIYDFKQAYLRYGTVKKLVKAEEELKKMGYTLLIWDAYRPLYAQYKLWEICPDSTYVANPNTGYSSHSRGNTVDITMVSMDASEGVIMPTDFDDFSLKADRDYSDCSKKEREYVKILENVMIKVGFKPYSGEWWHFSDTKEYSVLDKNLGRKSNEDR